MKKYQKKNLVTIKTLKKDVKTYLKLEKTGENAKAWYESFAVNNLLESLEVTLAYVYQMKKQEFDVTILFAMELINKFQSEELARNFIWKYFDFYKGCSAEERIYEDAILPIFQYIENEPNYNRIDFAKEMKEMMRSWKGRILQSYIENSKDDYNTIIRLCIENQVFDIDNAYMAYWYSRENIDELTCFSCKEEGKNVPLESSTVGGKCKENIVGERIENIFIIAEMETGNHADGEKFEFSYEVALVLQTESHFYVFWRHLIFDTLHISVCKDLNGAVESIKELNEDDEEMENVTVVKSKVVETL